MLPSGDNVSEQVMVRNIPPARGCAALPCYAVEVTAYILAVWCPADSLTGGTYCVQRSSLSIVVRNCSVCIDEGGADYER